MTKVEVSRQQRIDGAIRTSIFVDEERLFHQLEHENIKDPDPVLEWFIDVEFTGEKIPTDVEPLRDWLLQHAEIPTELMKQAAQEMEIGLDEAGGSRKIARTSDDARIVLAYSAIRRVTARNMGKNLRSFARQWRKLIRQLPAVQHSGT